MELLLILIIVLFLFLINKVLNISISSKPSETKPDCPPHKWSYNYEDRMQCIKCNFIAGTFKTDRGDY